VFPGQLLERPGARTGNGLRQRKIRVVFALAEIPGTKQFLRTDDPGALLRRLRGERQRVRQVRLRVPGGGVLQEAEGDRGHG
jgi:hypothetical protein